MSYDPTLEIEWAGELRRFRLGTGEIIRLQDKAAPDGPWVAFEALRSGRCKLDLIHEVIRQGLIGGGKTALEAAAFHKDVIELCAPDERRMLALAILATWQTGAETVPKKADAAEAGESQPASTPQPSTATAPSSASRRAKSTRPRSGNS